MVKSEFHDAPVAIKVEPTAATFKILIVEDEPGHIELIRRAFEFLGSKVELVIVQSIREARLRLANFTPDLTITDYRLPDGNAIELIQNGIDLANYPVVVMTGQGDEEVAVQSMKAGAIDYIVKSEKSFVNMPHTAVSAIRSWNTNINLKHRTVELAEEHIHLEEAAQRLSEANIELAYEARMDHLTGLLNRGAWEEVAQLEHERSQRHHHDYGLLMIDLDHFKLLNDSSGHSAGDDCLRQVAKAIPAACRGFDLIGRYGGEEFIVLLPETDLPGAEIVADRINKIIWNLQILHPQSPTADRVTVSIGITTGNRKNLKSAIINADLALYAAKHGGRNRVSVMNDNSQ